MSTVPRAESKHFAFVNALRGIAAVLVMLFHQQIHTFYHHPVGVIPRDTFTWWVVYGFFDLGKYAVAVFFLISGFLIPATLRKDGATLRDFAIHRAFRLYPAYWLSIAVRLVALAALGRLADVSWGNVAVNLTMLQKFVGQLDFIGVFWTLQIELIFYVLCAVLFAFRRLDARWPALLVSLGLALLCAAARMVTGKGLPVALFLALTLMFLGDTLRAYGRGEEDDRSLRRALWTVAVGVVPVSLMGYGREDWGEGLRYVLCYEAALATFLLCWRRAAWFETPGPRRRVLDFLGDISYGMYLNSSTVLLWLGDSLMAATGNRLLTAVATLPTALLLAGITYRWIEAPAIRWGRRLTARP